MDKRSRRVITASRGPTVVVFVLLGLFTACSSRPNIDLAPVPAQTTALTSGILYQSGTASWYGDEFNGRRTANGEIYNMYRLTAAHQILPFHTIVRVENVDNRKSVHVRINDRGPFVKQRIIDLSYSAAQAIGMTEKGTARVNIYIHSPPANSGNTISMPQNIEQPNSYYLQAGAFTKRSNGIKLLKIVITFLPDLQFKLYFKDGLYKIMSRKINTLQQAEHYKKILFDVDIEAFIKTYY